MAERQAILINANSYYIPLAPNTVHCVVTSPPYLGLRDYQTGEWSGGDENCDHLAPPKGGRNPKTAMKQLTNTGTLNYMYPKVCAKCGAVRIDNQIGQEDTIDEYVNNIVNVFREVHRILRPDGVAWLVIGDSFSGSGKELKRKDLMGIPWRVALALQADGWWLRKDIIWWKRNAMTESPKDRPANDHEYVFLLSKNAIYFYDGEAVKVPTRTNDNRYPKEDTRNLRSVWDIPTESNSVPHFATYPSKLVEICIKAGTSEAGCCSKCGKQVARIVEKTGKYKRRWSDNNADGSPYEHHGSYKSMYTTVGWRRSCSCDSDIVPSIVFDPFIGSGTTIMVANALGRHGIGCDISAEYLVMAKGRIDYFRMKDWIDGKSVKTKLSDLPLFT